VTTGGRFFTLPRVFFFLALISLVGAWFFGFSLQEDDNVEQFFGELMEMAGEFRTLDFELIEGHSLKDGYIYQVNCFETGGSLGYVTASEGHGYGGSMTVMIAWSLDGAIESILVPVHNEDRPWWNALVTGNYFEQYIGRVYSEPLAIGDDIDAASGSTVSSVGVASGVRAGRQILSEQLGDPYPMPKEPIEFGAPEFLLVIGIGMVVTFRTVPRLRRVKWLRYLTLAFGLGVLGIWLSIPLSLANFVAWPLDAAPRLQTSFILYILFFGIVGLAVIFGRNYYCFWLCPYAAVQEGLHLATANNIKPAMKWWRLLRNTRYLLLWAVLMVAFILQNPAVTTFEPWNPLFSFIGSMDQWLLVAITILAAMFIYNFWCHYLCPVGAMMDLVLKVRKEVVNLWGSLVRQLKKKEA